MSAVVPEMKRGEGDVAVSLRSSAPGSGHQVVPSPEVNQICPPPVSCTDAVSSYGRVIRVHAVPAAESAVPADHCGPQPKASGPRSLTDGTGRRRCGALRRCTRCEAQADQCRLR